MLDTSFHPHQMVGYNYSSMTQLKQWFSQTTVEVTTWASCQIRKIAGAHAPGMPGTFSPSPQVSDPDMHHDTCVTHVPLCMPGSLTSSFLWNRRRGKRSRHSRRMRNLQFYVSGKRPMGEWLHFTWNHSCNYISIPWSQLVYTASKLNAIICVVVPNYVVTGIFQLYMLPLVYVPK